mmetsp:Transcript_121989/g.182160  ORF Transcript_121989/g.182160 Transcript_121989/m.182160 type:complete len:84 (-) Transcript_121989:8-259(-)
MNFQPVFKARVAHCLSQAEPASLHRLLVEQIHSLRDATPGYAMSLRAPEHAAQANPESQCNRPCLNTPPARQSERSTSTAVGR